VNEVAVNSHIGANTAKKAIEMSHSAKQAMNVLTRDAEEIGQVTDLIKRVAAQTNLLAINARIEATSAGLAGRGFAVVADEIKMLAKQSAQAAEDIAARIGGVQDNTAEAVKSLNSVSTIIEEMDSASTEIMESVEKQTVTATEIALDIRQANTGVNHIASAIAEIAKGTDDVAANAAQSALGIQEVSQRIQALSNAVGDSHIGARQVTVSAGDLAKLSSKIQNLVGKFKVKRHDDV